MKSEVVSFHLQVAARQYFIRKTALNVRNNIETTPILGSAPRFTHEVASRLVEKLKPVYPATEMFEADGFDHGLPRTDQVIAELDSVWKETEEVDEEAVVSPGFDTTDPMHAVLKRWGYR